MNHDVTLHREAARADVFLPLWAVPGPAHNAHKVQMRMSANQPRGHGAVGLDCSC